MVGWSILTTLNVLLETIVLNIIIIWAKCFALHMFYKITDLHCENIIARGSFPLYNRLGNFVMHPKMDVLSYDLNIEEEIEIEDEWVDSVFRTGMLLNGKRDRMVEVTILVHWVVTRNN